MAFDLHPKDFSLWLAWLERDTANVSNHLGFYFSPFPLRLSYVAVYKSAYQLINYSQQAWGRSQ